MVTHEQWVTINIIAERETGATVKKPRAIEEEQHIKNCGTCIV